MLEVQKIPTMTLEEYAAEHGITVKTQWEGGSFKVTAHGLRTRNWHLHEVDLCADGQTPEEALDLFGRHINGHNSIIYRTKTGVKSIPVTFISRRQCVEYANWIPHLSEIAKVFNWIANNPGIHPNNTRSAVLQVLEKIKATGH